ncbi:mannose-1-phosphate guanylyltransferase/mannose-6-phosphate isomerase [Enterovirga rhinocerotis]|uniref:mannose-1-phosphate guanylyltransferase n=1 Tax=Enterovirga rhinocerotis TaxID=1339210 RepID=A0A4R7BY99_9HYPH|nr:mannose-1-phosphate guanylyltransferase/mannose-6-phosphate isomerase [Enterovirga rhinocerotis]TDR88996.1 mannose-1-phosphate guanylyltransferase (GDP) /mannose-6-phosphate isomerase type 2 [Enterovirga rhinocerotis]
MTPSILPVIMCGGSGTRLWPASRESMPKQFISLIEGQPSTFRMTVERVSGPGFLRPVVISSSDSRFVVAEQLAQAGIEADILLEPERRDSAAAVAVAACQAAARGPETIVLILAADHLIGDDAAFAAACRSAAAGAERGLIMTLGIAPTRPATGYGYILAGDEVPEAGGARRVARFVEKPDAAGAERLIAEGALWNGGYFLFRADVMTKELSLHAPKILSAAKEALDGAKRDLDFIRLDPEAFAEAPKTSIDYAVMEKTDRAGVLAVSFPWNDVGTWSALWDAAPRDADGNAIRGRVAAIGTRDSLVYGSDETLTAVVGLDGIVVVTTPDAVLVTSKEKADAVKDVVASLRAAGHAEADEHRRMYRPWGWYQRIDIGTRFQVKRILVHPQGRLSLQKHFHRAEHWVVVRGTAEVTVDDRVQLVHENEAVYLPIGCTHRLVNPGRIPLELIEIQVGSYTGEDDIVRVEDIYGRG